MRTRDWLALLCACLAFPCCANAQGEPQIVAIQADPAAGLLRGTITNPLNQPLTAWYVDAVDAAGRPLVFLRFDPLLRPDLSVPAQGSRVVEVAVAGFPATGLVLRAALRADGLEVGSLRQAFALVSRRHEMARLLEDVGEYLLSVDPSAAPLDIYSQLVDVVAENGHSNEILIREIQGRATAATVAGWRRAAEDLRETYQLGAVRYGALLERMAIDRGVKP